MRVQAGGGGRRDHTAHDPRPSSLSLPASPARQTTHYPTVTHRAQTASQPHKLAAPEATSQLFFDKEQPEMKGESPVRGTSRMGGGREDV